MWISPALAVLDTLLVGWVAAPPVIDGAVTPAEWGDVSLEVSRPQGPARVWIKRDSGAVYVAGLIPDTSVSWMDDLVISLDMGYIESAAPDHDDFQWYFRRVIDSSEVFRGQGGKWQSPRGDPDWRLRAAREGGGWSVRAQSNGSGWSLELKLDLSFFQSATKGASPRIAFRTFDDAPQGWQVWPESPDLVQPTALERIPERWVPVQLVEVMGAN